MQSIYRHVAYRKRDSWFLSMLINFPYVPKRVAFSHQLETGGKFLTFYFNGSKFVSATTKGLFAGSAASTNTNLKFLVR